MAEQLPTLLVPPAARSAHAELLAALGTETNPGQWMLFMSAVTRLLPDVLSSGRPTKEAIQRCAIGQLGFSSWQAMIEAPVAANGLGWNFSAWKAWRRAWSVVQTNSWLLDAGLSSAEVNAIAQECRQSGTDLPGSLADLESFKKGRKDAQEARRAETAQALTLRVEAAEIAAQKATEALAVATEQLTQVRQQLSATLAKVEEQAEIIGALKTEKATAEASRDHWKAQAQAPRPAPKKVTLSRWQHFLIVLGLRPND